MNIKSISKLLAISIFCGCNSGGSQENDRSKSPEGPILSKLDSVKWIIGAWRNHSSEGRFYETWSNLNEEGFEGKSCFLIGNDTMFQEKVKIVQRENDLIYISQVENQNNGKSIEFKLTNLTETSCEFENPTHDYPQKLTYKKLGEDSCFAKISGMSAGQYKEEVFPMGRRK